MMNNEGFGSVIGMLLVFSSLDLTFDAFMMCM